MGDDTARVARAGALAAMWPVLAMAAAVATYLGMRHIQVTHGVGTFDSLCNSGETFNCDKVNTSAWSELLGIPISLWALPLYAIMAYLAGVGRQQSARGAAARGALVGLAGACVLVSVALLAVMHFEVQAYCVYCMSLDGLHVLALALALAPGGARRVALPAGQDLRVAVGLGLALTAAVAVGASGYAGALDDEAITAVLGDPAGSPTTATGPGAVQTERRAGGAMAIPTTVRDVVVDDDDPSVGPTDAAVVVVEYADFECSYCKQLTYSMGPIKERFKDRVRFVFKHFPMDTECNDTIKRNHHPRACESALAAVCAHQQGQFWAYHDLLFKNQAHLEDDDLLHYARDVGLDEAAFGSCLSDPGVRGQILGDIRAAAALEITGTPRTYVNGREMKGAVPEALLEAVIKAELGEAEVRDGRVDTVREVVLDRPLTSGPVDMVPVEYGGAKFYMDAVEASLAEGGRAVSVAGVLPANASWFAAKSACEAAGKRLCTQSEWLAACQSAEPKDDDGNGSVIDDYLEGNEYPYAPVYKPGFCHDRADRDGGEPRAAGAAAGCHTAGGIYDLVGNVQEWVGASEREAVLLGGAWYAEDKASCRMVYDTFGPGMSNRTTGFRCCSDAPVAADVAVAPVASPSEGGIAVGAAIPTFVGQAPSGDDVGSTALEGKVGLINFWATWCAPCQRELPELSRMYAELSPKGFEVIAVNVDRERAPVDRFLNRLKLPFLVLLDPDSRIVGQYEVMAMPTSVLVDRSGRIVEHHTGFNEEWFAALREKVEKLLAE